MIFPDSFIFIEKRRVENQLWGRREFVCACGGPGGVVGGSLSLDLDG